jgi:DNA-binding transcriptional LysR family regulator
MTHVEVPKVADLPDVDLLRLFCTIVECRGFSAAQAKLNISPSSISNKMSALEARLGMRLCRRGRGGFHLTSEGRRVYDAAVGIFRAHASFSVEIGQLRDELSGELRVGVIDSTVTNPAIRISDAVGRFRSKHPMVHLTLQIREPAQIERNLLDGSMHVGLAPFYHHVHGLSYQSLLNESHELYCASGHPLFARAPRDISIEELSDHAYVARSHVPPTVELGREQVKWCAEVSDMEAMAHLILSGQFIGFMPVHFAYLWTSRGRMRAIRPDRLQHTSHFEIATSSERKGDRLVCALMKELTSSIEERERVA